MTGATNGKWVGFLLAAYSLLWLVPCVGGILVPMGNGLRDWRHSNCVAARFLRDGKSLALYTLDYSGEALVKWELPHMKMAEIHRLKFDETLGDFLRLWLTPQLLVLEAGSGSQRFLIDRQKPARPIPILHGIGDVSVVDDRCFVLWLNYPLEPAVSMSGFVYRTNISGAPELIKQLSFELPVRRVLYRTAAAGALRCLYIGLDAKEVPLVKGQAGGTVCSNKLSPRGPLMIASLDITAGSLIDVKNLGLDCGASVAIHNLRSNEIILGSAVDHLIVLSAEDFTVKGKRNWAFSFPEPKKDSEEDMVTLGAFAPSGQYVAYCDPFGKVVAREWPSGKVVLYDNHHKLLLDRYCKKLASDPSKRVSAALTMVLMGVQDIAFVDSHILALSTGSGHVYLYDVQRGQRLHTHLVCREDFLQQ